MNQAKPIRWGIIGCGDVTEVKSGPGLQKADGSQLVAVMRRDAEKARDYAKRHNVPRAYGDAQELIDDPEVDAVYVATPPGSHAEYAIRVAKAGKPVYVEKPMARTHAECLQMVQACRSARGGKGVPLFVAYYRRRLPRFLRVKQLIDDGAIGDIRLVTMSHYQRPNPGEIDANNRHWHVIPEIAGGGRFLDMAPHGLDILDYLLGPIEQATGTAVNQGGFYKADDIVAGHWRHKSGVLGTGVWCFTAHDRDDRVEIVGTRGTITFAVFETTPVRLWTEKGRQEFPEPTPPHVQQPLIQTIVDELRGVVRDGVGKCPSTGDSAARTNWVTDQMLASWRATHP
jgi:predicted dehydrogenase